MNTLDFLYTQITILKQLIFNRNHLIGEYDKNAEYEISLSEFEYELYEKTSYLR